VPATLQIVAASEFRTWPPCLAQSFLLTLQAEIETRRALDNVDARGYRIDPGQLERGSPGVHSVWVPTVFLELSSAKCLIDASQCISDRCYDDAVAAWLLT
jgi:hypothetical protein